MQKTANDSDSDEPEIISEEQKVMWAKIDDVLKGYYLSPF